MLKLRMTERDTETMFVNVATPASIWLPTPLVASP